MDGMGLQLIADGLLIATALAAAIYCAVLSRRLRRLASTGDGIGGQIVALNGAVEETKAALTTAQERIDALRNQSGNASERVRREMAQARMLAEELSAAGEEARGLLDKLYAAEPATIVREANDVAAGAPSGSIGDARKIVEEEALEEFAFVGVGDDPGLAGIADASPGGAASAGSFAAATNGGIAEDEADLDAAFEVAEQESYSFGAAPELASESEGARGAGRKGRPASRDAAREGKNTAEPMRPGGGGDDDAAAKNGPEDSPPAVVAASSGGSGRPLRLQRMAF